MKKNYPLVALALAVAMLPMTSFAQTTGGGTGGTTTTNVSNGGTSRATNVGFSLWAEVQKFSLAGLELSINLRNNKTGQLVTGIKGKTLEMIPFWGVAKTDYTIEIEVLPLAAGLRYDGQGRPLMKVNANAENSVATDQRVTMTKPDAEGRVLFRIDMSKFTQAEMLNLGFKVEMVTGRDYAKTWFITWSASNHWEGAMARITIPVKGAWPTSITLNDDSMADYQTLAAAETGTGVPQYIGGIIRYNSSSRLTAALASLHNPVQPVQSPVVTTNNTVTVTVDQRGRIVEAAPTDFKVDFDRGDLVVTSSKPGTFTVHWKLLDGYSAEGKKKEGSNVVGSNSLRILAEALATAEIEWKDSEGKVHVYYVVLPTKAGEEN